jgi:hypothetical protein
MEENDLTAISLLELEGIVDIILNTGVFLENLRYIQPNRFISRYWTQSKTVGFI